ncbi:MAG: acetyl-CoA carboxylase [Alphaproteobacteria bacterium]|nr:acetyl-CoA carboxylase [Alphaproteobacteria bacterium]
MSLGFRKILIANRGEIACRVIRTAKAMGYRTVAVHSPADTGAPHVAMADQAVQIGGNLVGESYLKIDLILDAAKRTGADAIHPGYGFLSENEDFAQACANAGIVFIGPPAAAIAAMGNKRQAKLRMIEAGVPCVPGYEGADQSDSVLLAEAKRIGLPIMVKAAAGGGGRGMRLVTQAGDIAEAIKSARSEAENAFGSGELILERAVVDARHVEIQVFGDSHGNVIHLGERDCSIQRRHQKIVEESPSPAVDADLRARMGEAAVKAARSIGYQGAGTVEFLLGGDKQFYFLEMNTRLQVEHPVTEMITGQDLVAWQLIVAAGGKLPLTQEQVTLNGHAIEVRLYAEDAYGGFLPQTGTVRAWQPPSGDGVRVDHGIRAGQSISSFYDPMLAKIIAWGADRKQARRRLLNAVEDCVVLGPTTNKHFLAAVLDNGLFASGGATTAFIGQAFPDKALSRPLPSPQAWTLAAALICERNNAGPRMLRDFRNSHASGNPLRLVCGEAKQLLTIAATDQGFEIAIGKHRQRLAVLSHDGVIVRYSLDGVQQSAQALFNGEFLYLDMPGFAGAFEDQTLTASARAAAAGDGRLLAPMDGRIVSVTAASGARVDKGQILVVLEAMKMQHQIKANVAGTVETVAVKEGDQVSGRALLVLVRPDEAAKAAE